MCSQGTPTTILVFQLSLIYQTHSKKNQLHSNINYLYLLSLSSSILWLELSSTLMEIKHSIFSQDLVLPGHPYHIGL